MGIAQIPAPSGGLAVARFPARSGAPFNIPAGLTLQNTVTSTTTFSAGQLPAQVWAVIVGGGGGGGYGLGSAQGAGGGGGGGVVIGWVDVPSAGITATIGAGGNGSGSTFGSRGGITYFGSMWAQGGGGGASNSGDFISQNFNPRFGPGQSGYGGQGSGAITNATNAFFNAPIGAPLVFALDGGTGGMTFASGSSGLGTALNHGSNNYFGGGAGGCVAGGTFSATGGSGYTGGGGGATVSGGNSSRDGGLTNTFTGGTGTSGTGGGGGAGFLANGSNATTTAGGAGGSGGGGGGSGISAGAGAAGGNGCVLIYY